MHLLDCLSSTYFSLAYEKPTAMYYPRASYILAWLI